MLDPELQQRLDLLDQKIEEVININKGIRNYNRWMLALTLLFIFLPIVAALFLVPAMLNSLSQMYGVL